MGIDFRGAQCSGSELRGIGRYTVDLLLGLIEFAPSVELTLFHKHNAAVPAELQGHCKLVPIEALSWTDPTDALWTKIPKIRSSEFLHTRHWERAVREQKVAMEAALAAHPVDLLHIPSALDIGSYPLFDYPCPVVMTFLDGIVRKLKSNTYDRFRPFQQRYYDQQGLNLVKATRVVAISHASAADAVEMFGVDPARVDVVYPAVPKEYAVPHSCPSWISGKPYFLFCSVPDPHKNPEVVLNAFSSMPPEFHLVMVSPKVGEFIPKVEALATSLGFRDRLHITGFVSEEELIGLFQHATALVSPSQMEGFGLPVAQAMRAGTPVVTSRFSAKGEIAAGVGYLVDPNSVDELAKAMLMVIDVGRESENTMRGFERVKLFDAETVTNELVESYRRALQQENGE